MPCSQVRSRTVTPSRVSHSSEHVVHWLQLVSIAKEGIYVVNKLFTHDKGVQRSEQFRQVARCSRLLHLLASRKVELEIALHPFRT